MRPIRILLVIAATMASLARIASAQPTGVTGYEATSIGVLDGFNSSDAWALDDFGRLVGQVGVAPSKSVVWINGELHVIPAPPGGDGGTARELSPTTGVVVGNAMVNGRARLAVWKIDGRSTMLANLAGSLACYGFAINDPGWMAGTCYLSDAAVLWRRFASPVDLGHLGGGSGGSGSSDINEHGEIVGRSYGPLGIFRPFLWRNGEMIDIGGEPANASGYAYGINDQTEVVGDSPSRRVAFHWFQGVITDLPEPYPCGSLRKARAINSAGVIVGQSADADCRWLRVTIWERQEGFRAFLLDDFIPRHPDLTLVEANDINDAGQVAAFGEFDDGRERGLLVTPYLFEMSDPVPGRAGTVNTITVTGLQPNQRVHLVWGTQEGAQKIRSACPGGTLLIRDPQALQAVRADANGVATINVNVPLIARGRTVRLQAVAPIECQISHTVTWTFE
ncbi:MAG: hypothetical protein KJZ69_19125 [Phycisphaerales bacterium]|nr:hypothetical protein [Phycisphaerales bacterium]